MNSRKNTPPARTLNAKEPLVSATQDLPGIAHHRAHYLRHAARMLARTGLDPEGQARRMPAMGNFEDDPYPMAK